MINKCKVMGVFLIALTSTVLATEIPGQSNLREESDGSMETENVNVPEQVEEGREPLTLERASLFPDLLKDLKPEERGSLERLFGKLYQADLIASDDFSDKSALTNALLQVSRSASVHKYYFPDVLLQMLGTSSGNACHLIFPILKSMPEGIKGISGTDKWYRVLMRFLEQLPDEEKTYETLFRYKELYLNDIGRKIGVRSEGYKKIRLRMIRDKLDEFENSNTEQRLTLAGVEEIFQADANAWIEAKGKLNFIPNSIASTFDFLSFFTECPPHDDFNMWKNPRAIVNIPCMLVLVVILNLGGGAPCHGHSDSYEY